jgi:hypothetical protein
MAASSETAIEDGVQGRPSVQEEVLYFKDFSSGAMIESVVRRGKKLALKRCIGGGEKGVGLDDLLLAVREEFKERGRSGRHPAVPARACLIGALLRPLARG